MKQNKLILVIAASIMLACVLRMTAAAPVPPARFEYATIRWDGRDNTHIVRPGGQVEFTGTELRKAQKPDRADDRAFYMNLVMNGLTKEGYEFAGMTNDEIVMKRTVTK